MLQLNDISLQFAGDLLYKHVDLLFQPDHCYGIIGANGAGKSTLLRIISGELPPTTGTVTIQKEDRMSVLEQNHFKYDEYSVMDTVIMGNRRLYDIMKEKDALYMKPDFSDEDGERAAVLEGEFAEMNGWDAETEAAQLLNGMGIPTELHQAQMSDAGRPPEGESPAGAGAVRPSVHHSAGRAHQRSGRGMPSDWLEDFLVDCSAHRDRGQPRPPLPQRGLHQHRGHRLHKTCKMYAGNYDFWYDSSQLFQQLMRQQNKKREEKIRDLQEFIRRFAANKSKSRQATSRKKVLDSMQIEQMPASSRKYPFVGFEPEREAGKDILTVENLSKTVDGVKVLDNVTFTVRKGDKIAFVGDNEAGSDGAVPHSGGRDRAGRGQLQVGRDHQPELFPQG